MGQDILLFGTAMPCDVALVTERDEKPLGREFVTGEWFCRHRGLTLPEAIDTLKSDGLLHRPQTPEAPGLCAMAGNRSVPTALELWAQQV
jgi:hypothetical protein